jgi:hypothetical protein
MTRASRPTDRPWPHLSPLALAATLAVAALAAACGSSSGSKDENQDAPPPETPPSGDATPTPTPSAAPMPGPSDAPEVKSQTFDASSTDPAVWVYLDLDDGTTLDPAAVAAAPDAKWDVAFQRYQIKTNGGVSGHGDVVVAFVDQPLADVEAAPTAGYLMDRANGANPQTDPGLAYLRRGGWYDYDATSHKLTPKARTYVVRTTDRKLVKTQVTAYYDDAGSPAHIGFTWQALSGSADVAVEDAP